MEPAKVLLTALQRRGVRLQVHNGKLRYTPLDLMDDETLQALRHHKAAILAILDPDNGIERSNNDIEEQYRYEENRTNVGDSQRNNDITMLTVDSSPAGEKEKSPRARPRENKIPSEDDDSIVKAVKSLEGRQNPRKTQDYSSNDAEKNTVSADNNIVRRGIGDLSADPRDHISRGAAREEAERWAAYDRMVLERMKEIEEILE